MAVEPDQRAHTEALAALADAAAAVARMDRSEQALAAVAAAAARATGAEAAVVRVLDAERDDLVARGVVGPASVAAQLECSRVPRERAYDASVPELLGPGDTIVLGVDGTDGLAGTVELFSPARPFDDADHAAARAVAAQLALVLRLLALEQTASVTPREPRLLELAGEALAAGAGAAETESHVVRLVVELAHADGATLWRADPELHAASTAGTVEAGLQERARASAVRALERGVPDVEQLDGTIAVALRLGEPAIGVLQLFFPQAAAPAPTELDALAGFAVRAAHALRIVTQTRETRTDLERTRALLAAVAAANEQLSLAHAVETAIERVRDIVGAERAAVYLRDDDGQLFPEAARGLAGPHSVVAHTLLALALGPFRARGFVAIADADADDRFRDVSDAVAECGIDAAVALPLVVGDETIGLLAAFPPHGYAPDENEGALLTALAGQLAVVVQNARLHDRATALSAELEQALVAERDVARRLRALHDISGSFAQSLSLDVTLAAVVETIVEHLEVDAAVIRLPDARRELLVPHAFAVADARFESSLRPLLYRAQPISHPAFQRAFRGAKPVILTAESAPLLAPFIAKGSSAAVFPIATPTEVIATVTVVSLDPDRRIDARTIDAASAITAQAALAIDNARLYQQQKDFADAMQRSLLPQVRPDVRGLDVGEVYAASARMDVGGDLYDYVALADGRLAVVLGDVTGHGIDAAADMAMAKFVFRTLVREHPEPSDFLRAANQVVVDEIAPGKFITLLYLVVDPETGLVRCGSGGHPPPRLVSPAGEVVPLAVRGLALGIDVGQEYDEATAVLAPGGAVVLFTDGVLEARSGTEMYGFERLDALLGRRRDLGSEDLAAAVIHSARRFTGGELLDDCAVVVVKRI